MSEERVTRVLAAAYDCFAHHGFRKTTMDDIANGAGMSRPAIYQYVRNKSDAFRRVAGGLLDATLTQARQAAAGDGTLTQRLDRTLAVKLASTARLLQDGPYAIDVIRAHPDLDQAFGAALVDLLSATIEDAAAEADLRLRDGNAREVAELVLALSRGLEADLAPAPDGPLVGVREAAGQARERLHNGVALMVAGLAAATNPSRTLPDAP